MSTPGWRVLVCSGQATTESLAGLRLRGFRLRAPELELEASGLRNAVRGGGGGGAHDNSKLRKPFHDKGKFSNFWSLALLGIILQHRALHVGLTLTVNPHVLLPSLLPGSSTLL